MPTQTCCRTLKETFTLWFALLLPIVTLPLPLLYPEPVAQCGYCVIVVSLFWVTEVIPLPVTALLPVLMYPLFGILSVDQAISNFATRPFMLFLSSLMVASGVEKWNLHKRLALRTLTLVGPEPKWLLIGVMFPTWFMSMWISNTAATAMMLPIVLSMLLHLKECQMEDTVELASLRQNGNVSHCTEVPMLEENKHTNQHMMDDVEIKELPHRVHKMSEERFIRLAKTFTLATAYSANIGGMATLIGTPPNIIFKRLADKLYNQYEATNPVNFANWLAIGFPLAVVLIVLCWFWLLLYAEGLKFLRFWKKDKVNYEKVRRALRHDYESLGPISFPEIMVTVAFAVLVFLWVTRAPGTFRGWGSWFKPGYAGDSTPSILVAVLLFILPARPPAWMRRFNWSCVPAADDNLPKNKDKGYEPLLDWKTTNSILAWNILILIGGGFALADGCEASGFSDWVADHLDVMSRLPAWLTVFLLTSLVSIFTEVACNGAAVVLFVPLMGSLAVKMEVNPLYFMVPGTCASNLSFLLPAAHPSNAIIFNSGYLSVLDMARVGFVMNIVSIVVLNLALNSWMTAIYSMDTFPEEFKNHVATDLHNLTVTNATTTTT